MGFTLAKKNVYPSNMRQTPQAVANILDVAGRNVNEAAAATGIDALNLHMAASGKAALCADEWRRLLDVCGRRSFDEGCDE